MKKSELLLPNRAVRVRKLVVDFAPAGRGSASRCRADMRASVTLRIGRRGLFFFLKG